MTRLRTRPRTPLLAAALTLALAAGCGGDDDSVDGAATTLDDDSESAGGDETEATPPVTDDATEDTTTNDASDDSVADGTGGDDGAATPSGVLRYGAPIGLITFDPHMVPNGPQLPFLRAVYDSLIGRDADGTLVPGLATEWGYVDDTTFELVLREDVTFSDGTPFDAAAVVANFERMRALEGANAAFGALIDGVEAIDASTVRLQLTRFSPTLANDLSLVVGMMISPNALVDEALDRSPVGTGPYVYDADSSIEGELRVFELNPDHWDPTNQPAERVEIREIEDASARLNALEAGEIDFATILSPQVEQARAAGLDIVGQIDLYWSLTVLDREGTLVPEFADVRVRQALAHAIDREAIAETVFFGQAIPSAQPYPEDRIGHNPDLSDAYPYDPDRARELLAEAGAADLSFAAPALPFMVPYMEALQAFFRDVGVTMEIDVLQPGTLATAALEGRYPVWTSALAIEDPHVYFEQIYSDSAAFNVFGFATPALMEAGALGAEIEDRGGPEAAEVYAEYARVLVEEGIVINVAHDTVPIAHGPVIASMEPFPSAAFPGYRIFTLANR